MSNKLIETLVRGVRPGNENLLLGSPMHRDDRAGNSQFINRLPNEGKRHGHEHYPVDRICTGNGAVLRRPHNAHATPARQRQIQCA